MEYLAQGITTFEEVFDLNIALGETMTTTALLNEEELKGYNDCIQHPLEYSEDVFKLLVGNSDSAKVNEFGDTIKAPSFHYLRGKPHV